MLSVILIFFTEFNKYYKNSKAEKNFYFVRNLLEKEVYNCIDINNNWIFGLSCSEKPILKDVVYYFNHNKKLINPHDNQEGVNAKIGSVFINIKNRSFILSVDIDANGGIDINHLINFN